MRYRFERIGLVIGIVLAALVIIAVISRVLQSDQGPLEPTLQPTAEPTIGPTIPATPTPTSTSFDPEPPPEAGSLLYMLGYAPDRLQDDSLPLSDIAQYANIQMWMDAQGVPTPNEPGDSSWAAWHQQLESLAIPEVLATRGTDASWISTYGFGLHQVDQVLAVGSAPDYVLVMRGDFDADVLLAAWADSGYQAVRANGVTYWSLYPGGSVDLSAPASRPALGNMNNVVLLEDGTLIATARSDRLEQTLGVIYGGNATLAENADIRRLLRPGTEPEKLATAILLKGTVLEERSAIQPGVAVATPVTELPQAQLMLAGLHIHPQDESRTSMVIVAAYDNAEDATAAHHRARHELATDVSGVTGYPFNQRVVPFSMRVVSSGNTQHLLLMHLTLLDGAPDWRQIVEERDFGYLMWPRIPQGSGTQ